MGPPFPSPAPKTRPNIIPYGSRVSVRTSGQTTECWIQKCHILTNGTIEYDGSTSSGDTIRFSSRDVFLHDITVTPTQAPADYVFDYSQYNPTESFGHQRHEYHMPDQHWNVGNPGGPHRHEQVNHHGPDHGLGGQRHPGGLHRNNENVYQTDPFHDDENSNNSDNVDANEYHTSNSAYHTPRRRQNTNQRQRQTPQYAQNAFVYPKGTLPQYVREDKASTTGKSFTAHLGSNEDPRDFYKDVRQEVIPHKVLLRAYDTITKISGLLEINAWNCDNYESAKKVMSRYLYIFFAQGKDTMFDANAYARNSLVNYEREQDGLSFLHSLIKDHHTDLRSTVHRANITDAYTLPKFDDDLSLWKYIHMMQIYFKEVNKHATQVDILRLIHAQLFRD